MTLSTCSPDRVSATLARRDGDGARAYAADRERHPDGYDLPAAKDARIDLKLLAWQAQQALELRGTAAARDRLALLDTPDLWAGTVQDGAARGMMVALEEAIDLCKPPPADPELEEEGLHVASFEGKELRRKKDILVKSGGARIRFSRKEGVLFVDRKRELNVPDCLRFEDRADCGSLDGFEPEHGTRARLFSPAFVKPQRLIQSKLGDRLVLQGRLGRSPAGFPCRIVFEGRATEDFVRLTVSIANTHTDHRLRLRFLGIPLDAVKHHCTDVWENVQIQGRRFAAATLVRGCGTLVAGENPVPCPGAQCLGTIEHRFDLG